MRIAAFCGSTSATSANRRLLDHVGDMAVACGDSFSMCGGIAEVPVFRPELVDEAPASVVELRAGFEAADAIVFAIPEYGGGAAGWAKNALDWMVGSGSLHQRPAAVLCAGNTGGPNAIGQIARTLTWQGAFVVATLGVAAPATKLNSDGAVADSETIAGLAVVLDRLLEAARADDAHRFDMAAPVVEALGIHSTDRTAR